MGVGYGLGARGEDRGLVLNNGEEATFTIEILTFRDTQLRLSLLRTEYRLFGLLCLGCHSSVTTRRCRLNKDHPAVDRRANDCQPQ